MTRWWRRPKRRWWLLDDQAVLVWDFYTHRAARRAADRLNASAVVRGTGRRYRVEPMP